MKKRLIKLFALLVGIMLLLGSLPLVALADDAQPSLVLGPLAEVTHNGEVITSPVSTVHSPSRRLTSTQIPPAQFRLTDSQLTPVRDQNPYGTCWAHAAYASAESIAKSGGLITDPDFSEWQLSYFAYTSLNGLPAFDLAFSDSPYDEGGDDDISTAILARGSSPVLESEALYGGADPSPSVKPEYDLKETYVGHTLDEWKQLIMKKGALAISFCYGNSYYKSSTFSYYDPNADYSNHEVAVVGWDDTYAVSNFNPLLKPPGPGAWIVKNSWGTGWGQSGYFYMSYYDKSLETNAVAFELESRPSKEKVYTYDELGLDAWCGYTGSNSGYIMCAFKSAGEETLNSVGTFAMSDNTTYSIMVSTQSDPSKVTFSAQQSGTITSAGFARIDLNQPVSLSAGEKYEVVISLSTPGFAYPLPLEYRINNYSTQARFAPGKSFCSSNGLASSWEDLYSSDLSAACDACIFAYATSSGPVSYTAEFNSQGGSPVDDAVVVENSALPKPADPTRTGYTFAGWYKESSCVNAWNFDTDHVAADVTLFAKWTINKYTVTFDSQGGSDVAPVVVNYSTLLIKPSNPIKTGYTFAGWYREQACSNAWHFDTDTVTSDITLWAKWTINNYTVTFDSQGGSAVAQGHADYNTPVSKPDDPTKAGYTFAGWYKEQACSNAWHFDTDLVTASITLWAKWTENTYTVTFDSQGGSAVDPVQAPFNSQIAMPTNPTKDGFVFGGWYKDTLYSAQWLFNSDQVAGDTTLFARWMLEPYAVTYDSQGGSPVDPTPAVYGFTITAPPDPSFPGFVFDGWYKDQAGQNPWNFASDIVLGDTTLFAKWHYGSLATPQNASAASASATSILVSWDAVPGATGYVLQRATSASGPWSILPTPTGTSYTDTNLASNQICYYRVCAFVVYHSVTYYGGYCSPVSAVPLPPAPALSATAANYNTILLSWSAVPGAVKYELYRATVQNGTYKLITTTAALSYSNTSLTTGQPYYYKARAYILIGGKKVYGGYSAVASAATSLSAPATVSASSASYNSVKITWASVAGKSGYEVWRSSDGGVSYAKIGTASSTSFTDKNLATGSPYSYKVMAYRTVSGKKVYSVFSTVATATPVPATPKAKAARVSSSSIKVSWGSIAGASGYEIEICAPGGSFAPLADTNKTSAMSTGLTAGMTYQYRVRAYRMVGGNKVYSGYSAVVSAKP